MTIEHSTSWLKFNYSVQKDDQDLDSMSQEEDVVDKPMLPKDISTNHSILNKRET